MIDSESQWPNPSNTSGLEEGNMVSQFHIPYTNSPHAQHPMDPNPEDIPIPSIEDDLSCEPRRIVFVLPKLHAVRWCVRALSILITVIAVILILVAIGLYNHAKEHVSNFPIQYIKLTNRRSAPGHHLDMAEAGNRKAPSVTNFPCVVFASVGAMNVAIGIGTLLLACVSEKVRTRLCILQNGY